MSSQVKIDQATLSPAGTAGKSRTDGKAGGQLVTLTNTGSGSTTRFRLLWVPAGDTTAVSTLAQTGPKVFTFTPTASRPGTYRIQLIENEGLSTEYRETRTLKVRTPVLGLSIPGLNEVGDPSADLLNAGAAQIAAAEDNADDYPIANLNAVRYGAWWRWVHEITVAVDSGSAPSSSDGATLVAGNQNTDQITFQTVGGIRLSAAESAVLASCVFRAVGFTTNAADAMQVRLFNVTTAAAVAGSTLSFTNTVSAELSAAISLPAGDNVYEVQIRLATTGSPNRAVALNARLTPT